MSGRIFREIILVETKDIFQIVNEIERLERTGWTLIQEPKLMLEKNKPVVQAILRKELSPLEAKLLEEMEVKK